MRVYRCIVAAAAQIMDRTLISAVPAHLFHRTRPDLKIILAAVEHDLADAWERHCGELPDVAVHRGSILDLQADAVVSPANSFGFMDGGIDHRIRITSAGACRTLGMGAIDVRGENFAICRANRSSGGGG